MVRFLEGVYDRHLSRNADLSYANLQDISWDEQTNWEGVQGLETAVNVPEALKRQLGME